MAQLVKLLAISQQIKEMNMIVLLNITYENSLYTCVKTFNKEAFCLYLLLLYILNIKYWFCRISLLMKNHKKQ